MKRIVYIILLVTMMLCFISCEQIEDTNGDENTDLCKIATEDIFGIKHSFVSLKTSKNTKSKMKCDSGYNKIFGIHEDEDVDYIKFKGGPCSGTQVLMATLLDTEQIITLCVTRNIDSGNLQIFLVSPEKEIIYEFGNDFESYELCAKQEGKYNIVIGAESFVGQIEIERHFE